ncbi:MAG: acyl-CoA dehydrogenase family protein [Mesorhizobium sp.]|nr:acyl-CoA dehydrogenase family protein [Mesorhizobium sp.]
MDFDLSEEQAILKQSVERMLERHALPRGGRELWRDISDMGLTALPFPENLGGLGGSSVETMIVMEAFGRALVLEPYVPSVILGGACLMHGASLQLRDAFIPGVVDGSLKLALATAEIGSGFSQTAIETRAIESAGGFVVTGRKCVVLGGDEADWVVVSARTGGGAGDETGVTLFIVNAASEGVTRQLYRTQDNQGAAEISFDGVHVTREHIIGAIGGGMSVLSRAVDTGIAALCAEAVGVMSRMHEMTLDYIKQRKQFGAPLGANQALQHRAAEMFIALEQARSMAIYAAIMVAEEDAGNRGRGIHAAKAEIGRAGRLIGEQAVQLHGGIGMTSEYPLGKYYKRMTMIDLTFGDADHHLAELARKGAMVGLL